jgi:hypothetical protein
VAELQSPSPDTKTAWPSVAGEAIKCSTPRRLHRSDFRSGRARPAVNVPRPRERTAMRRPVGRNRCVPTLPGQSATPALGRGRSTQPPTREATPCVAESRRMIEHFCAIEGLGRPRELVPG